MDSSANESGDEIILLQSVASAITFEMTMTSQVMENLDDDAEKPERQTVVEIKLGSGNPVHGKKDKYEGWKVKAQPFQNYLRN